ncbi:hypothetical protein XENOCAPTIV_004725 [Xenoophorus captivus]|uniref:Microtubule-associated protein n=1 Tax=Xenoophorus captivus TaxID=1517983 RepID=A0ABV0S6J0_9TELE
METKTHVEVKPQAAAEKEKADTGEAKEMEKADEAAMPLEKPAVKEAQKIEKGEKQDQKTLEKKDSKKEKAVKADGDKAKKPLKAATNGGSSMASKDLTTADRKTKVRPGQQALPKRLLLVVQPQLPTNAPHPLPPAAPQTKKQPHSRQLPLPGLNGPLPVPPVAPHPNPPPLQAHVTLNLRSTSSTTAASRTRTTAAKPATLSPSMATAPEKKPPVTRTTRPATSASSTTTSTASRPMARPGTAPAPDIRNVRSKIGSTDNIKHQPGGGKVGPATTSRATVLLPACNF